MNAILDGLLAGTGLAESDWIALVLAVNGEPHAVPETLLENRLLEADGAPTDAGRALHRDIRAQTDAVVDQLWGDLPADDLATTARVLQTVYERARAY
jgi:uncharacterized protein YgfB (UPF0149 family)